MGFLDRLKTKVITKVLHRAIGQKMVSPTFVEFGNDIMNDDTVLTIANRILDEYSKLNPRHIRTISGRQVKVTDNNINNLLEYPNQLMTKSDFLRKIAFLRETYDNVFIYPAYDVYRNTKTRVEKKVYTGLYPIEFTQIDFYEDDSGTYYVQFKLLNGETSDMIPYDEVIHWRKEYGMNEFMGGGINGLPNNSALLRHLKLNDKLMQSTFKTIEGSLVINGVLKYGGLINEKDREAARKRFEEQLKENQTGIISLDSGGDYIPIPYNGKLIDKDTLEFFKKQIRQHYGVSEAILDGDYTNEQKEAFYETVIEAGVISLGQAFSRVLLTPFERSNGNTIIFYTNKVQMMSADKKMKLAEILMPVGGVTPNMVLSWFGEPPYDGGDDRYISLNWVKKDIADDYQLEKYKNGGNASNNENNNLNDNQGNEGV